MTSSPKLLGILQLNNRTNWRNLGLNNLRPTSALRWLRLASTLVFASQMLLTISHPLLALLLEWLNSLNRKFKREICKPPLSVQRTVQSLLLAPLINKVRLSSITILCAEDIFQRRRSANSRTGSTRTNRILTLLRMKRTF